jgi:hypothetical protein
MFPKQTKRKLGPMVQSPVSPLPQNRVSSGFWYWHREHFMEKSAFSPQDIKDV